MGILFVCIFCLQLRFLSMDLLFSMVSCSIIIYVIHTTIYSLFYSFVITFALSRLHCILHISICIVFYCTYFFQKFKLVPGNLCYSFHFIYTRKYFLLCFASKTLHVVERRIFNIIHGISVKIFLQLHYIPCCICH